MAIIKSLVAVWARGGQRFSKYLLVDANVVFGLQVVVNIIQKFGEIRLTIKWDRGTSTPNFQEDAYFDPKISRNNLLWHKIFKKKLISTPNFQGITYFDPQFSRGFCEEADLKSNFEWGRLSNLESERKNWQLIPKYLLTAAYLGF